MEIEAVIGLEVHAELETRSKMFCACPVVDSTQAEPNQYVCPVCAGMPGTLPVLNQRAVEFGLQVALALQCQVNMTSIFARKNYFYPDLPKGYQISQYEEPLARNGKVLILTSTGERLVHIRRVHLEEDTGKLTHIGEGRNARSLIDLNRAGVPLLEIVTEPDLRTAEEVRIYAMSLRSILRYLGVNSGDMQKGVLRIEPNISIRPVGSKTLGTRTEIKNLNSFRALERATEYEIQRQQGLLERGLTITQETRGWDETKAATVVQRTKEEAEDYRYFPEPDLPPLVLHPRQLEALQQSLPELPLVKQQRFQAQYGLGAYDASVLVTEKAVADYFETTLTCSKSPLPPKMVANWITGELFSLLDSPGDIETCLVSPQSLAELLTLLVKGEINQPIAKSILNEIYKNGTNPRVIVETRGLQQISDSAQITYLVKKALADNPLQVKEYLRGKETLANWFFGQVMRMASGKASPALVKDELERQLSKLKTIE
jgi:aspartyl-tRNA(Asn)/glutamyl-tRNA(Gln) amidotransferase subunit B